MTTSSPADDGPDRPGQRPPDWSTPATVADAPPIGGTPPAPRPVTVEPDGPVPEWDPPTRRVRARTVLTVAVLVPLLCYGLLAVGTASVGTDLLHLLRRDPHGVRLDQATRDGTLEFRVRAVRCGVERVGDPPVSQDAIGRFCLVQLDVRNVGHEPATFSDALQTAYGPAGERYAPDSGAGLVANADQQIFLDDLNPGALVSVVLVYDIPPRSRIVRLRLHDTPGSRGALVDL
jgi:hypothetical protein